VLGKLLTNRDREELEMAKAPQGLQGFWTYRSFRNNPAPIGDLPDDQQPAAALALLFGEGDLTIETADKGVFKAALSFGGKAIMDLVGTFTPASGDRPAVATARGAGRKGSGIENFHYNYVFYAVPPWKDGIDQRQALVGTVVRAADHGTAKKGYVASTVTVRKDVTASK
jgi:hypothetical protein